MRLPIACRSMDIDLIQEGPLTRGLLCNHSASTRATVAIGRDSSQRLLVLAFLFRRATCDKCARKEEASACRIQYRQPGTSKIDLLARVSFPRSDTKTQQTAVSKSLSFHKNLTYLLRFLAPTNGDAGISHAGRSRYAQSIRQ